MIVGRSIIESLVSDGRIVGNFRKKNRNLIVWSSVTFGKKQKVYRRIVGNCRKKNPKLIFGNFRQKKTKCDHLIVGKQNRPRDRQIVGK